jgi:Tfp pilus assembly protein PilF
LKTPFPAYSGNQDFLFVCYAHADEEKVYADLEALHQQGVNLWYDEGISAGLSWRGEIAKAISGAKQFLFFISNSSLQSKHCLREVHYAIDHDIEIIPIYTEDCDLPPELELVFSRVQALFRFSDDRYLEHVQSAIDSKKDWGETPTKRAKKSKTRVSIIALVSALLVGFFGYTAFEYNNNRQRPEPISAYASGQPNTFQTYLAALDKLEKWYLGDNLADARRLFEQTLSTDPSFALAKARLAETLRLEYVLAHNEEALNLAMIQAREAIHLNSSLATIHNAVGFVEYTYGNIDLAITSFETALSLDANSADATRGLASVYFKMGRLSEADTSFRKATDLNPDDPRNGDAYANFLVDTNRPDEAIKQYSKVLRQEPDYYPTLVNMGGTLADNGKYSEAVVILERAIKLRKSYMGYVNLGSTHSQLQRFPESVTAYKKAIEFDDSDWLAWGNLAYVYSYINEDDELVRRTFTKAISLAESARVISPRDNYINSDLALYYSKIGDQYLAETRLQTALALAPNSSDVHVAAAEVYWHLGNEDMAKEMLEKSVNLGSSLSELQRNPDIAELVALSSSRGPAN